MTTSLAYGKPLEELDLVLVHDNRGAQAILRSMVSSMHIARLRVYERAEKALHDMMIDPPTALIAEWNMKPVSGYRLVRMIRNSSMAPLCFMPILAVTPMPTLSLVDKAFSVGVNNILVMPIAPVVLRRRLEWLRNDSREFVADGDQYVLEGVEEILDERVRRNDVAALLRRQKAMQEALTRRAETAQDLVDRIVNGEVDLDNYEDDTKVDDLPPDESKSTWNSWTMA